MPNRLCQKTEGENRDVAIDSGEQAFQREEVPGPDGLYNALTSSAKAVIEQRLRLTYLPETSSTLKNSGLEEFLRKKHPGLTWMDVVDIIQEELRQEERHQRAQALAITTLEWPTTPWLDAINAAAEQMGIARDQLVFELEDYALRNTSSHTRTQSTKNGHSQESILPEGGQLYGTSHDLPPGIWPSSAVLDRLQKTLGTDPREVLADRLRQY